MTKRFIKRKIKPQHTIINSNKYIIHRKSNDTTVIKNISKTIKRSIIKKHDINVINSLPSPTSDFVFIIGGGPSIRRFDFNLFSNCDIIAVNKAIEKVNYAKVFITMDYTFLNKTKLSLNDISSKSEYTYFVLNNTQQYIKNIDGVYTDTRTNLKYTQLSNFNGVILSNVISHPGFGNNIENFANGNNSGYCALQLAILMGYKKIFLLGFDFSCEHNRTHFHNDYNENINTFNNKLNEYKKTIINSLKSYDKKNIYSFDIYNSQIDSYIKKDTIKNVLNEIAVNNSNVKDKVYDISNLIVVGYYTKNTPYEIEANKLIESVKKLNLNYDIVGISNLGNWQANTRYKAKFLYEMLLKHSNKKLLYVDCDAVIHKKPILFENYDCDIGVRWQDFRWRKNECLSGTIYLDNNDKTKLLCKKWMKLNQIEGTDTKNFEQWNLGKVIIEMRKTNNLIDKNLPPEYTFIYDIMKKIYPDVNPIIEHFQASRRLKNKV